MIAEKRTSLVVSGQSAIEMLNEMKNNKFTENQISLVMSALKRNAKLRRNSLKDVTKLR
jgi:hypothetical protein